MESDEISDAVMAAYDGKIINLQEQAPIMMRQGNMIVKVTVTKVESLTPNNLTYGNMVEETNVRCYPADAHKAKIKIIGGAAE